MSTLPVRAGAEQASEPSRAAAGQLDVGANHSCAVLDDGRLRCWGFGTDGQLGYGNTTAIGDNETPGSVGPVNFGTGRTAIAISAGDVHTCALLNDGSVHCWGFGANGRLGYGNTANVNDAASAGPVELGTNRTATAIAAGGGHTCAVLDNGTVRCWGFGTSGALGYGNTNTIGDNETPGMAGPVDLGPGRKAVAVTAGAVHTCVLLEDGNVLCWGEGGNGRLGYGNQTSIGDDEPVSTVVTPVNFGSGRTAVAISAGGSHTCAVLNDGTVRCWGFGGNGQLGYGNTATIESPGAAGPVPLGLGATATAISAGQVHTCARLGDGNVRCWGDGGNGRLGYANTDRIGDDETPDAIEPVNLGFGRTAVAISAGQSHTCARLDNASVRCWGYGGNGRLGYCSETSIGDDEVPGATGPVDIGSPGGGAACPPPPSGGAALAPTPGLGSAATKVPTVNPDAVRARGLRACLTAVAGHANREEQLARHGSARRRTLLRRHRTRHVRSGHRHCVRVFARTPGRVTNIRARTVGRTQVQLDFSAPGTDASHAPPARSYVVKQARRPIVSARGFARAQTLCKGVCRFTVSKVGGGVTLTVTDLRPHTTYYYAVAARD
ncbi:MAG: hypothetical protein M3065_00980, partial [Actinomycetota bacterium]|nr:hypothetical protein [Actinomycetota bacterium]